MNESLLIEDKYVRVGADALDYLRKLENGHCVNCEVRFEDNAVNVYTTREASTLPPFYGLNAY